MHDIFLQFAIVVAIAVFSAAIVRLLRQPLIVGYIFTGILAGPLLLGVVRPGDQIEIFSSLGVSLLLFIVGLGLNPSMIRQVGAISIITGFAQMIFTMAIGFVVCLALGFSTVASLYLSISFAFSSTIIVLRLLQEKEHEDTLYGRISIGFLLIQDLAAMFIFLFLSASTSSSSWQSTLLILLAKLCGVVAVLFILGRWVIPRLEMYFGKNKELLLLSSLGFCFIGAATFELLGFSRELGALSAGVLLSFSPYFREIGTRIQPLRDFFLVVFFVFMGANVTPTSWDGIALTVIIFSLFILIGNPLILLLIMARQGYSRKVSFFVGLTVAQISEFSLILVAAGMSLGHIDQNVLTIMTMVGLITITVSSYLIIYNEQLYRWLLPVLRVLTPFAHERDSQDEVMDARNFEILLLGAHRLGGGMLQTIQDEGISYLVVDHDPRLIRGLKEKHVVAHFGSADDPVFLDSLDFSSLKLVISTIPDQEVNQFLVDYVRRRRPDVQVIGVSHHKDQAKQLYDMGASYVVMPPYLGRRFMVDLFKKNLFNAGKYALERRKHLKDLSYLSES